MPYNRPKFKPSPSRPIRIPTEEKINMIIAESGKVLATKLTLSKETGLRPVEVHTLKVKDVDLEQHLIYPTTAKRGASRTIKISNYLASLLQTHITRFNLKLTDNFFRGTEEHYGDSFRKVRDRLAKKLQNRARAKTSKPSSSSHLAEATTQRSEDKHAPRTLPAHTN